MKVLDTTLKGNIFEKQVYDLLKEMLENDELYISGKKSKIFAKKGYYSEARKSEIIFDIAIETYINVTCSRKITPSEWRESTKIEIGDFCCEKNIYRRADRGDSARI